MHVPMWARTGNEGSLWEYVVVGGFSCIFSDASQATRMAALGQVCIGSRRGTLGTYRRVARADRGKHTGLVVDGAPHPVPPAASWTVYKAFFAAQISHHVGHARCEWKAFVRCGTVDPCWAVAAGNKSRRVTPVVERASR